MAATLPPETLLSVRNLRTYYRQDEGVVKAVDGATFDVPAGKTIGIVGESGCGKSVTARSILRIVERPGRVEGGEIWLRRDRGNGREEIVDLVGLDAGGREMRDIRGGEIGLVFQEPMTSFSPVHTIGNQIVEAIRLHMPMTKAEARQRAIELFRLVGIPRPDERIDTYSYQLSGGLRQRAMIAMALAADPQLLIADEPTTALDVTTQAQILDLLRNLQQERGMAIMLITHDLGVIAEMADEVVVMYLGRVVERGPVDEIFYAPKHPYTRALLRSIPSIDSTPRTKLPTITGSIPHPYNRPAGCPFNPRCPEIIRGVCETKEPTLDQVAPKQWASCFLYEPEGAETVASRRAAGNDPTAAAATIPLTVVSRPAVVPATNGVAAHSGANGISSARATSGATAGPAADAPVLLDVQGLQKFFPIKKGFLRRTVGYVRAVDDVSFTIQRGETLALVGESGCGKTTTSRCILRAIDPSGGQIGFRTDSGSTVDVAALPRDRLRPLRRQMQMIFQDPYSSLNPRMTLADIVGEPLLVNGIGSRQERIDRVEALLKLVGMRPEFMRRYPHAFSGGQRQRIGIARALALNPSLVVADEPVSALDVSVQAQILNLLLDLQEELGLTYLFVAHDLSVVKHISDRVAVMYVGKIVELADRDRLFYTPKHPYTAALLSAVPTPDPRARSRRIPLTGEVANPAAPPSGCYFHPRCPHAIDICTTTAPAWEAVEPGHYARCHRAAELKLEGIPAPTA